MLVDEPRFTRYFETVVLRRRPYLKKELVRIDIDNASAKVDLNTLKLANLPAKVETVAA